MRTRRVLRLLGYAALAACGGGARQADGSGPAPGGSAIVIQGSELASGNVLDALRTRIPTMSVATRSGECPRIMFRGPRTIRGQGNPSVYVDGTLMLDTCVLTQISNADVDFLEVYPSGNTSRAGVQRNGFGLILVFRRRGQ